MKHSDSNGGDIYKSVEDNELVLLTNKINFCANWYV